MAEEHLVRPTFSIVIPSYNDGDLALTAVASCLAQEGQPHIEVIVVDDGSTNGSMRRVAERFGEHPCVRVVRKENGGLASARNFGLERCHGDWIIFLDADDLLEPLYLQSVLDVLSNVADGRTPDVVLTPFRYFAQEVPMSWRRRLFARLFHVPRFGWNGSRNRLWIRVGNCFPVSSCVISRACCMRVGGFDRALKAHEDWDYWIRVMDSGATVAHVPAGHTACATRIRIRDGMSADASLMRETQRMVRDRHCAGWPYALLRFAPARGCALALRTLAGLAQGIMLGHWSNLTGGSDLITSEPTRAQARR
ncbi:MAG: glycosyltransferase family 2 protein [Acidobacteriota bacterium]